MLTSMHVQKVQDSWSLNFLNNCQLFWQSNLDVLALFNLWLMITGIGIFLRVLIWAAFATLLPTVTSAPHNICTHNSMNPVNFNSKAWLNHYHIGATPHHMRLIMVCPKGQHYALLLQSYSTNNCTRQAAQTMTNAPPPPEMTAALLQDPGKFT